MLNKMLDYRTIKNISESPDDESGGAGFLNDSFLWKDFSSFMRDIYKLEPVVISNAFATHHKWSIQYVRSDKIVCTVYPEKDKFIVLFVADEKEGAAISELKSILSPYVRALFSDTCTTPIGKCLLIQVTSGRILEDVKKLTTVKLYPTREDVFVSRRRYWGPLPDGVSMYVSFPQKAAFRKAFAL